MMDQIEIKPLSLTLVPVVGKIATTTYRDWLWSLHRGGQLFAFTACSVSTVYRSLGREMAQTLMKPR